MVCLRSLGHQLDASVSLACFVSKWQFMAQDIQRTWAFHSVDLSRWLTSHRTAFPRGEKPQLLSEGQHPELSNSSPHCAGQSPRLP